MKSEKIEKENSEKWWGGRNVSWPFTIFIVVLLLATQFLILHNIRHYYFSHSKEESKVKVDIHEDRHGVKLKPVRLDAARFEIEVIKPHKSMRAKFPQHPDMVIKKLSKLLEKERNR